MKYLFLCSTGQNRSPTAADVAAKIARRKGIFIDIFYGGIDVSRTESTKEVSEHYQGFDRIFVMEQEMIDRLMKDYGVQRSKIRCLNIEDIYGRDDLELVKILKNGLEILVGTNL
jgi:predicted protein tyrosine phosphatase